MQDERIRFEPGKVIEQGWKRYQERVLPPGAPAIQIRETRRAFYQGIRWFIEGLLHNIDPGSEPTETDLELLDSVQDELDRFLVDVEQGRA